MRLFRLAFFVGFAATTVSAFAWNDFGHMVVADIAERTLKPEVRQRANVLLLLGGTTKTREFLTCACWADDSKNQQTGLWHYINYHFRADGKPSSLKPLEENVVWAIRKFSAVLKNKQAPDAERADALRYLVHFVGDIHQPLHSVARATETLPEGDRGGNDFKIVSPPNWKPAPRNLHFLWDMGCGLFGNIERPLDAKGRDEISEASQLAIKLNPEVQLAKQIANLDPEAWAEEGLALAKAKVYSLEEGKVPPPSYLEEGRKIALKQVALAGYRLGRLLNQLLG